MIEITMIETVQYRQKVSRERLIELLDLSEDTTEDCLVAIVDGNWEVARGLGLSDEVFDAKRDELDGDLLDEMLNHFDACIDRTWDATQED